MRNYNNRTNNNNKKKNTNNSLYFAGYSLVFVFLAARFGLNLIALRSVLCTVFCFVLFFFVLFSSVVAFSSTILSVLPVAVAVVFCGLFPDVVGVIYKSGPEEKFTCSRTSCWSVLFGLCFCTVWL